MQVGVWGQFRNFTKVEGAFPTTTPPLLRREWRALIFFFFNSILGIILCTEKYNHVNIYIYIYILQ